MLPGERTPTVVSHGCLPPSTPAPNLPWLAFSCLPAQGGDLRHCESPMTVVAIACSNHGDESRAVWRLRSGGIGRRTRHQEADPDETIEIPRNAWLTLSGNSAPCTRAAHLVDVAPTIGRSPKFTTFRSFRTAEPRNGAEQYHFCATSSVGDHAHDSFTDQGVDRTDDGGADAALQIESAEAHDYLAVQTAGGYRCREATLERRFAL